MKELVFFFFFEKHKSKEQQIVENLIKGILIGLKQSLATESPLKLMKNVFYITLKTLFVLTYLNFCLHFLVI